MIPRPSTQNGKLYIFPVNLCGLVYTLFYPLFIGEINAYWEASATTSVVSKIAIVGAVPELYALVTLVYGDSPVPHA